MPTKKHQINMSQVKKFILTEPELADQFKALCAMQGISMTGAFKQFIIQSVKKGKLLL